VALGDERLAKQFDDRLDSPIATGGTGIHGGASTAIRKRSAVVARDGSSRKGVLAFVRSVVSRPLIAAHSGR
jgi:hypothetical protein